MYLSFSASRSCRERREDRCSCQASCCTQRLLLGGAAVASDLLHLEQPDLQMRNIQRECGIARPRLTESSATVSQSRCRTPRQMPRPCVLAAAQRVLQTVLCGPQRHEVTVRTQPTNRICKRWTAALLRLASSSDSSRWFSASSRRSCKLQSALIRHSLRRTHSSFASPHCRLVRQAALDVPCQPNRPIRFSRRCAVRARHAVACVPVDGVVDGGVVHGHAEHRDRADASSRTVECGLLHLGVCRRCGRAERWCVHLASTVLHAQLQPIPRERLATHC